MNSLPADQRGQGAGMSTTTQNSAMVLSIGIFFPHLISAPFTTGLHQAFDFAIAAMLIGAAASWLRGSHRAEPDAWPGAGPGPGGYGHNPNPGSRPGSRNALPDR